MLKILEKNSIGRETIVYSKRFAGLVIGLKNRYWADPFFRSEFNVILLQFIFAGLLLCIVAFVFNFLYQDISDILLKGITESIKSGNALTGNDILNAAQSVKTEKFYGFLILTFLITLGLSYFIAKVTLSPARDALK